MIKPYNKNIISSITYNFLHCINFIKRTKCQKFIPVSSLYSIKISIINIYYMVNTYFQIQVSRVQMSHVRMTSVLYKSISSNPKEFKLPLTQERTALISY